LGLNVPAVSAETALTGITQNLYMPKTDAAEDELGFALQSNFYQIGYDQRGRIKTFNRSALATLGWAGLGWAGLGCAKRLGRLRLGFGQLAWLP
jgi:hypothetical protein